MVLGCCVRIAHIRRYNSGRSFLPRPKKRGFGQLLFLGPRLSSVQVRLTAIAIRGRVLGFTRAPRQQPTSAFGFELEDAIKKLAVIRLAPLPLGATDRSATS
jgi:hypothetical protein